MDLTKFQQLLEQQDWPAPFLFKFIVPQGQLTKFYEVFSAYVDVGPEEIKKRPSRNGKYVGLTVSVVQQNGVQVLSLYQEMGKIEGIIGL